MNILSSQKSVIFCISLGIGLIVFLQWRSFGEVRQNYLRDRNPNIFREIQILKTLTDQLRQEIDQTRAKLSELSKSSYSSASIYSEIEKYKLLSGEISVAGPGISIAIPQAVDTSWFVDLQNELAGAGAEAVSVNKTRITGESSGFRLIPPQTLLIGNQVVRPPFLFYAVGDSDVLTKALSQPGGVISRLQKQIGKKEIVIEAVEEIVMGGG